MRVAKMAIFMWRQVPLITLPLYGPGRLLEGSRLSKRTMYLTAAVAGRA
jgi:hypothetical protein